MLMTKKFIASPSYIYSRLSNIVVVNFNFLFNKIFAALILAVAMLLDAAPSSIDAVEDSTDQQTMERFTVSGKCII